MSKDVSKGQFGHRFPYRGALNSGPRRWSERVLQVGVRWTQAAKLLRSSPSWDSNSTHRGLPNTPLNTPQQHSQQRSNVQSCSHLTCVSTSLQLIPPSGACPNQRLNRGYGSSFARGVVEGGATSGAPSPSCNPPSPSCNPPSASRNPPSASCHPPTPMGTEWRAGQGGPLLVHIAAWGAKRPSSPSTCRV